MLDLPQRGRRGFLFGMGATLFADPKLIVSRIPAIHGDGVHDDWEGLQSLMFGKPVRLPDGDTFTPGRAPRLFGGTYLLSRTLVFDARSSGATFTGSGLQSHAVDCALRFMPGASHVHLDRCNLAFEGPIGVIHSPTTMLVTVAKA